MAYGTREIDIACYDYSDGLNTTQKPTDVGKAYRGRYPRMQCVDCLNVLLHTNQKRPSVTSFATPAAQVTGMHSYLRQSGIDYLLAAYGGKLYRVNKTDGTATELYDFGATAEVYAVDWGDKAWALASGIGACKVEGTSAYRVGIEAPSGVTAAAAAGGSLPAGVYKIYVSYARKVSGSNVLYSQGQSVADVTIEDGSDAYSIEFTFANSSDAQVNNKVVWMTDAGGTTYYFYYETGDNTTTTFTVSDDSDKNEALLYTVQAAYNYLPPSAATWAHIHDKRLWVSVGASVYYSLQEGSAYDLERFDTRSTGRIISYPFTIESIFSIGRDLFLNTPGGIIRQPDGDPFARFEIVTKGYLNEWFKYPRTVQVYSGLAIGVTPDGVRAFDGQRMLSIDLAQDIKPEIQRIYSGYTVNNRPCSAVYRRSDRTEYHIGYYDANARGGINNRRLVMNLDHLGRALGEGRQPAWEKHDTGANYMAVDPAGVLYSAQTTTTASTIYKDSTTAIQDTNLYVGGLLQATNDTRYKLRSGSFIPDIRGRIQWQQARVLVDFLKSFGIRIQMIDRTAQDDVETVEVENSGGFVLDSSVLGTGVLGDSVSDVRRVPLPRDLRGYGVYVEITQAASDKTFRLLDLTIFGRLYRSAFT